MNTQSTCTRQVFTLRFKYRFTLYSTTCQCWVFDSPIVHLCIVDGTLDVRYVASVIINYNLSPILEGKFK